MKATDSYKYYGVVSRVLHWITAILVIVQLIDVYMRSLAPKNIFSQYVQPWHMTIGVFILGVMLLRMIWLLVQRKHRPRSRSVMARFGHFSIYVVLIAIPLSGLLQGYPVLVFDTLMTKGIDTKWDTIFQELHGPLAYILTALIAGHVFMAILHRLVHRDGTWEKMIGKNQ
ncbi:MULTISPECIES: cytochrome b [Chromohalobacter]|jgi:cytochrome b561|uniref:cytochrome b n=1 Tax=Chromohalobacter TaxID=42054 RepID=UPI000FFF1A12|nr:MULTISPECIES: cytochrome b/b6 domain-containing protein [Chromohalobacter]NQY46423.1 cytochrome b [Chromohalobacter sp.]RXE49533.1 hypothetical protein B4O83_16785 [Chromohalobacter salexigens]